MFSMALKDLRISPIRTFLTGFSMFIGIISMIVAVLVGSLGKEALISINAQMYGYTPTYSANITDSTFLNSEKFDEFINTLNLNKDKTLTITPKTELQFAKLEKIDDLKDNRQLYRTLNHVEVVYTTENYDKVYNVPMTSGHWFKTSKDSSQLEVVVNKQAKEIFNTNYVVSSNKETLNLTPFNVVGVVNDGKDWPIIYTNIKPLLMIMPNIFDVKSATVYWHNKDNLSTEKMRGHINDILYDTIDGKVDNISRSDNGDNYQGVIDMLQLGLVISASLLLFVAILGQINIGLSSLEQRTHELLIRRALGASKYDIALLVLSSLIFLSILVCFISIVVSFVIVYIIGQMLPGDSPISTPVYPVAVAFVGMGASVFTALLGGIIPAIKASRLEPALALR